MRREIKAHSGAVHRAQFSPHDDSRWILTAGEDNTAKIWNTETGELLLTMVGHTAAVTSASFSPDGDRVLTASKDFTAKMWDTSVLNDKEKLAETDTAKELLTLKGHRHELNAVTFSPDGQYALTASHDHTAIIWLAAPQNEAAVAVKE